MKSARPLIVVLGLGEMGLVHAKNLSKVRHIRVGIASTRSDFLNETAASLGVNAQYPTYAAALEDADVTGVVIATPIATHPQLLAEAAKAGKHIFCEKPLGYDLPAIRTALEAVCAADVRLMVGFMRRWDAAYVSARERILSGAVGKPFVVKCTSGDAEYPEKYQRISEPNALLCDLAVHDIDLARWLCDSEVSRVYALVDALTYPELRARKDADVGLAVLELASGAKAVVHLSRALRYGYNVTTEIVCEDGTLRVGDLGHTDLSECSAGRESRAIDYDFRARFVPAFEREMEAFADVVRAKDNTAAQKLMAGDGRYATAKDGLRATIVAEALVRSAESGIPVDVKYDD